MKKAAVSCTELLPTHLRSTVRIAGLSKNKNSGYQK
jgi:hypothetical protein